MYIKTRFAMIANETTIHHTYRIVRYNRHRLKKECDTIQTEN